MKIIKDSRLLLGYSQSELSQASGVSVPAIQQIEAGKGNPSYKTLVALLDALHLKLQIEPRSQTSWEGLIACGAPLMRTHSESSLTPSAALLKKSLQAAGLENTQDPRKTEALQALLLALATQYPSWYERNCRAPFFRKLLPQTVSGKMIKLRRIALAKLAEYL